MVQLVFYVKVDMTLLGWCRTQYHLCTVGHVSGSSGKHLHTLQAFLQSVHYLCREHQSNVPHTTCTAHLAEGHDVWQRY